MYFLEIPADAILELFGKTFFEFCQDSGYDKILQVLGATPRDFLQVKFTKKNSKLRIEHSNVLHNSPEFGCPARSSGYTVPWNEGAFIQMYRKTRRRSRPALLFRQTRIGAYCYRNSEGTNCPV